jgi:hypothetical protein
MRNYGSREKENTAKKSYVAVTGLDRNSHAETQLFAQLEHTWRSIPVSSLLLKMFLGDCLSRFQNETGQSRPEARKGVKGRAECAPKMENIGDR